MIDQLSIRENQMIEELSNGFTIKEIAERNFISPYTVDTHIKKSKRKTGARTLAHLSAIWVKSTIAVFFIAVQFFIAAIENDVEMRKPSRARYKTTRIIRARKL